MNHKKKVLSALILLMALSVVGCSTAEVSAEAPASEAAETSVEEQVSDVAETEAEEQASEAVETEAEEPVSDVDVIKVATLAGPTGMGLIDVINDDSGLYEVEILTMPDQIVPKIVNGEVDVATIPSNLAATLYQKTEGSISVIAINTFGVLHILDSTGEITELADLEGKTLHATGLGASPEYVLTKILTENGLINGENINVEFAPSHSDLSNAVIAGEAEISLLPEPYVSMTMSKAENLEVVISLNDEWEKIFGDGALMPMGVTVVQNSFLEEHPDALAVLMNDYQASVDFVHAETEQAAADMVEAGLIGNAAIAMNAIPRCEISFVTGEEAQSELETFLTVLLESNPASIGGSLPEGDFYYIEE